MPYIRLLQELKDVYMQELYTTHTNLKQAALSIMLAKQAGADIPKQLVVLPKLKIDFNDKPILYAEDLLREYGSEVCKILLLQGIGVSRKELIIQSSTIFLIRKSLELLIGDTEEAVYYQLGEFFDRPFVGNIGNTLKLLRTGNYHSIDALHLWMIKYAKKSA